MNKLKRYLLLRPEPDLGSTCLRSLWISLGIFLLSVPLSGCFSKSGKAGNTSGGPPPDTSTPLDTDPVITTSWSATAAKSSATTTLTLSISGAETVTTTGITLGTTGTAACSMAITGSGLTTRTVTLTSCTGNGTATVSIPAGAATKISAFNGATMSSAAVTSSALTVDNIAPVVSVGSPSASTAKSSSTITYALTVTGASTINVTAASITLNTTGIATCSKAVTSGTTSSPTVTLTNCTGDGTVGISVAAAVASDAALNTSAAPSASTTFTVDNTAPTVAITSPTTGTYVTVRNNSATFAVSGTCSAEGNGQNVTLKIDGSTTGLSQSGGSCNGSTWSATISTTSMTPTSSGSSVAHTLLAELSDTIGNTGTNSITLNKDLTPVTLTFSSPSQSGSFAYLTTNDLTFTVTNPNNLSADSVSISSPSSPFSQVSTTCGATIAAGATCSYVLRFTSPGERTNGNGTFSHTITFAYDNGSVSNATSTKAVSQTGIPATVTVNPWYTSQVGGTPASQSYWTEYIKNDGAAISVTNGTGVPNKFVASNTACDGSETDYGSCIHTGELRKVTATGLTCSDLTFTENLGVFNWLCSDVSGNAVFRSTGLNEEKGLRDLVNTTSWKNNFVTISDATYTRYKSTASAWWANTVTGLPSPNATLPGTQYVVYTTATNKTGYYNLAASHISIVTLSGAVLDGNGNWSPHDNGNSFNWFEIDQNANSVGILSYGAFNVFRNLKTNSASYGLHGTPSRSWFYNVSASNQSYGIYTYNAQGNFYKRIRIANNSYGITDAGSGGITRNVFTEMSGTSFAGNAFRFYTGANLNTISHVTLTSSTGSLIHIRPDTSANPTLTLDINQALIANSGSGGISFLNTTGSIANILSTDNVIGIKNRASDITSRNAFLSGNNSSSDCDVVSPGASYIYWDGSTCQNAGSSNMTYTGSRTLASSLVGKTATTVNYTSWAVFDPASIASIFQGWGIDGAAFPDPAQRTICNGGTCRLWDLRLDHTDTLALGFNDTASGAAFSAGNACPSAAYTTSTDASARTFLLNALEIPGWAGNQNGLCESGETCVYSPNLGAYQGHGGYAGTCTYNDGSSSVNGVTLYGYSSNGI